MNTKKCRRCGEVKPLSEYNKDKKNKDGHESKCKKCKLEYMKEYHAKNKEKILEYKKEYYSRPEVKDKRSEYCKEYNSRPEVKERRKCLNLQKNYGITLEERDEMIEEQGGGCKLCHVDLDSVEPYVDHNHITGKVRGVLCPKCNTILGLLNADEGTKFAFKVIKFIEENN